MYVLRSTVLYVLYCNPFAQQILCLDECTANIDPVTGEYIHEVIAKLSGVPGSRPRHVGARGLTVPAGQAVRGEADGVPAEAEAALSSIRIDDSDSSREPFISKRDETISASNSTASNIGRTAGGDKHRGGPGAGARAGGGVPSASQHQSDKSLHESGGEGSTVIVIAHRISTILSMPRVLVLEGGKVAEDGDPTALLAQPHSRFSALVQSHPTM